MTLIVLQWVFKLFKTENDFFNLEFPPENESYEYTLDCYMWNVIQLQALLIHTLHTLLLKTIYLQYTL